MNTDRQWGWQLDVADILSPEEMKNPQLILDSGEIIQDRADSTVFKRNSIFFKWYKCNFKSAWRQWRYSIKSQAAREYEQMMLCQRAGLPVCQPLWHGACGYSQSILITREVTGHKQLSAVIEQKYRQRDEAPEFYAALGKFLKKCFHSGIYLPDFHTDNILYAAENHDFVLIDVYGARNMWFFTRHRYIRMCHSLLYRTMPYLTVEQLYFLMLEFGKCRNFNNLIDFFTIWQKWLKSVPKTGIRGNDH